MTINGGNRLHSYLRMLVVGAGRTVSGLSSIFIMALIARNGTVADVAAYGYIFTFVVTLTIFAQFGLPQLVVRVAAELSHVGRLKELAAVNGFCIATVLVCSLALGLLFAIAHAIVPGKMLKLELSRADTALAVSWLVLLSVQAMLAEIFRSRNEVILATAFGGLVSNLLAIVGVYALCYRQAQSSEGVLSAISLGLLVSNAVSFAVLVKREWIVWAPFAYSKKALITESSNNLLTNGASALVLQSAAITVALFGNTVEIADYAITGRMISAVMIVNAMLSQAHIADIAALAVRGERQLLQRKADELVWLSVLMCAPPLVLLVAFPSEVIVFMFGKDFPGAHRYLQIAAAGFLCVSLTGVRSQFLIQAGFARELSRASLMAAVISVTLGAFAAYKVSAEAAVMVASATMVCLAIAEVLLLKRLVGITSFLSFARV